MAMVDIYLSPKGWNATVCDVSRWNRRNIRRWLQVCVQQDLLPVVFVTMTDDDFVPSGRWCRLKRLVSERIPGQSLRKARKLRDEVLNEETYMPTNEISIPIILCVLAIVVYLAMGSTIFHIWEEWDIPSAAYFCFITLSTVGGACRLHLSLVRLVLETWCRARVSLATKRVCSASSRCWCVSPIVPWGWRCSPPLCRSYRLYQSDNTAGKSCNFFHFWTQFVKQKCLVILYVINCFESLKH